jgi:hypothetical protein
MATPVFAADEWIFDDPNGQERFTFEIATFLSLVLRPRCCGLA